VSRLVRTDEGVRYDIPVIEKVLEHHVHDKDLCGVFSESIEGVCGGKNHDNIDTKKTNCPIYSNHVHGLQVLGRVSEPIDTRKSCDQSDGNMGHPRGNRSSGS